MLLPALGPALQPALRPALGPVIGRRAWSPQALFASGEQGGWYDVSDIDRYTDVSQSPELVANGDGGSAEGWTGTNGTVTASDGALRFAKNAAAGAGLQVTAIATVAGRVYRVSARHVLNSGGLQMYVGASNNADGGSSFVNGSAVAVGQTAIVWFTATATTTFVFTRVDAMSAGGSYSSDDISVREAAAISTATMFQDAAGTTPVTAVEQPVGLWLDKRLGALGALGPDRIANGSFTDGTAWTAGAGWSISGGVATGVSATGSLLQAGVAPSPVGKVYQVTLTIVSRTAGSIVPQIGGSAVTLSAPGTYTFFLAPTLNDPVFYIPGASFSGVIDNVSVREAPGNHLIQPTSASRPTYSRRYNLLLATATLSTQSVTVAAGSHRLTFSGAGSITLSGAATGTFTAGTHTITTTAGSLTLTVSGAVTAADLRRTIHAQMGMPAYQRVTTATNYDEAGFLPRLRFDGADDSMYSASSVNFTASDEMTVVAGLTKLNDSALGMVAELSANLSLNNGTFWLLAPLSTGAAGDFDFSFKGTNQIQVNAGVRLAPVNAVLAANSKVSTDAATLRYNGAQVSASAGDQGTGNFGNHVLFVGRRNNATLPFNGDIFQLIVRGALTAGADLTSAEQYVAARTGVTL